MSERERLCDNVYNFGYGLVEVLSHLDQCDRLYSYLDSMVSISAGNVFLEGTRISNFTEIRLRILNRIHGARTCKKQENKENRNKL